MEVQKTRAKGHEIGPITDVLDQHHGTVRSKAAPGLAEPVGALGHCPHFMDRQQAEDHVL